MSDPEKCGNDRGGKEGLLPTASFDGSAVGPGSQIGHFCIEYELGHGGAGVVYLAQDTKLGRLVAIKSMPPELESSPAAQSRFQREARLLASLNHPNIAAIHDIVEPKEGTGYLVLEYISGETLAERIVRGPLELEETLFIAEQIARAIAAAHEHGVIHRDLKPGNIKITPEGSVKVLDFGLAKNVAGESLDSQTTITQPGKIIGTPAYMSPEQAKGEPVDHRADIWSLGVVMYEMLAGELPFKGNSIQAIMHSVLYESPKYLSNLRRGLPAALGQAISKMMQKKPSDRYERVGMIVNELESIRRDMRTLSRPDRRSPSIAVLPFVNMSADKEQEYFCDGMAEELINALTHIEDLRVIARTSAFSYKGRDVNVRDIGRELNVETILEGSVRKSGNRLRITAQLVDTSLGHHLWSERYDREMDDVFAIQDEITSAIIAKLKPKLLGQEKARLAKRESVDSEVYHLYLRGCYFWNKRTEDGFYTAIRYFNLAIEQDPSYALAHIGLADCYNLLGYYAYMEPNNAFPKAKNAALRALEFDDKLAEAHTSLAWVLFFEWDWVHAESEFKQAIELNPNYVTAHHWYSVFLFAMERFDESIYEMKRAQEIDPRSIIINTNMGWPYYFKRRYDDAIEAFRNALLIGEDFWYAHWGLGWSYSQKEMYKEALVEFQKAKDSYKGWHPQIESSIGITYALMDHREKAQQVLEELVERSKQQYVKPRFFADLYFALEENEKGLEWLTIAFGHGDPWLVWIKVEPLYDSIRSDPRYTELLRKMNFVD